MYTCKSKTAGGCCITASLTAISNPSALMLVGTCDHKERTVHDAEAGKQKPSHWQLCTTNK
jgi:hypothetical protein